jgi:hypothetical protein
MRSRTAALSLPTAACLLALLLAGCGEPAPTTSAAIDCSPTTQWRAGNNGEPAAPSCDQAEAREAHVLGSELHGLRREYEQIAEILRADSEATDAGARQRRQRQLQVDMEAIEAEARVRGWIGAGASTEAD